MKMKEVGPKSGVRVPSAPSPLDSLVAPCIIFFLCTGKEDSFKTRTALR